VTDPIDDLPSPRFILVHSHDATLDAHHLDRRGHAFGPFDDYSDLVEFDAQTANDSCYRFAIPLVGPQSKDVLLTIQGLTLGARPGAMPLPPRGSESGASAMAGLMDALKAHMEQAAKEERKRAKKAAKKEARRVAREEDARRAMGEE
jgi:hypothetical protein